MISAGIRLKGEYHLYECVVGGHIFLNVSFLFAYDGCVCIIFICELTLTIPKNCDFFLSALVHNFVSFFICVFLFFHVQKYTYVCVCIFCVFMFALLYVLFLM